jgi:hypothetical protein
MDVHCTTCGEPWDVYHLRHDAIFETDLSHTEAKAWTELSPNVKLLEDLDDIRAYGYKAEHAAALIYTHFKKEFGFPGNR